jgi:hypothetical protein
VTSLVHSPLEINAQIHAIKNIQRELGKKAFNKLTWRDLFIYKNSLIGNFSNFKNELEYDVMMKNFLLRLNREGILGKELRKVPGYPEMREIVRSV